MFSQALLIAIRFACVFASNPAGLSLPCTPSQLEVERVYTYFHESIVRSVHEIIPTLQPVVSEARVLCNEVINMFECAHKSHINKKYVEYVAYLASIRPCLQDNRARIDYVTASARTILCRNYALCIQMYNYFKYTKQYLRLAGLFCTHKPHEPVDMKAFEAMAFADMVKSTLDLATQFSSAVINIQKGYESLRKRGMAISTESEFSMSFHCKSLHLFKTVLESLFPPIKALMVSSCKLDKLVESILDAPLPTAAPGSPSPSLSKAFAFRMNLELQGHLMLLYVTSRDFLQERDSRWRANTMAAIKKANEWRAENLSAERFLDVPTEKLPSASALGIDLQKYAANSYSANALLDELLSVE
ncbi:hypothetical protein PAPHI01_1324 [Pancytospora philotis]|nr:hypothetical protein PAPHI01_1324 [Pancytospora philotis]